MSAPAFTRGPWSIGRGGVSKQVPIMAADDIVVCELDGFSCDICADARLIAAAPELYADAEFLCARIRELEGEMTDDDELSRQYFGHVLPAVARMESALAEARGEQ